MSDISQRIGNLSLDERAAMERRLLGKLASQASKQQQISPRSAVDPCPLSFAQRRLWFLEQLSPGTAVYNIPRAMRLSGALDVPVLKRALDAIVTRHEALRTIFCVEGGEPIQVIRADPSVKIREIDLTGFPAADQQAELERAFVAEVRRPFDLGADLMLRATVARLGPADHGLLIVMHHIAADGWSMGIFIKELVALYAAYRDGRPSPLAPVPIQYADFSIWQRQWLEGSELTRQREYWRAKLAGAPAALDLPTDHPRPAVMGSSGERQTRMMPRALLDALKALSKESGATLFMTLLAAFQVLLHRYTGQDDISVGSPIAGRNRMATETLIGFFVNTLVMRTDLSENPSFRALLDRVKEVALGAFGHQDMPFEKLVEDLRPERSQSKTPLFQVMFILQNVPREALELPGLTLRTLELDPGTTKFDLTLGLSETATGLKALIGYSTELFEHATIARLLGHYETLLESIVAEPARPISDLTIMLPDEQQGIVIGFNRTIAERPRAARVHDLVAAQVERTPDAAAISFEGRTITYRDLDDRATLLARHLRGLGVGPDTLVGVCAERSIEMIVALYAVLKAGGAYVPIDPTYPPERIGVMLEDAEVPVLLTMASIVSRLPPHRAEVICLDAPIDAAIAGDLPAPGTPEDLAYVIYTSGSTGKPKGVAMPHAPLVNLITWQHRSWSRPGPKRTLQFASVSFDVSFQEIFSTLSAGGELVLISDEIRRDPGQLLSVLTEATVERAYLPPIVLQHLAEVAEIARGAPLALREIITAGEQLVITRPIQRFLEALPGVSVQNHYGPTEAHVVAAHVLPEAPGLGPVPIGKPIANARIYLLDKASRPVPVGVPGELYIGGASLARGYLRRPDLTAQRFVSRPATLGAEEDADANAAPERLYRTGDLCRYLPDGTIAYLGRIDLQVKIRGYRIELGEIEAVLGQHPAVREVVVIAREDEPGDKRLVAYFAPNREIEDPAKELGEFLREKIPAFMVPSAFVALDRIPVTSNGKVDRRALPAPSFSQAAFVAPRTPVESAVASIWAELLKAPQISVEGNFFELGGHSLLATRVTARVREVYRVEVPVRALFDAPTVAGFSVTIAQALLERSSIEELRGLPIGELSPADRTLVELRLLHARGDAAEQHITPRPAGGPAKLSFAQQRLWFLEQMTPGTAVYNLPLGMRVKGPLDVAVLERALLAIVARHDVLRTTFQMAGDEPVQVVGEEARLAFQVVSVEGRADGETDGEEEALRLLREEARRPFDLTRDPMLRALVVRRGVDDHSLLLTMHHIVSDGWSMSLLQREMSELYRALAAGRPPALDALPIQYADYAVWQRGHLVGEVLDAQLGYWRERLAGAPPFLEIPTDHPRPQEITTRGAALSITLSAASLAQLKALAMDERVTLFMTLLAAFQVLLSRYSGQRDVCVGTPIAGRSRIETEPLLGFFINTLVLRADLSEDPTFRALLAATREASLGAYAHQDIPFERLVEDLRPARAQNRTPLFQALFILQNTPQARPEIEGVTFASTGVGTGTTKFDLTLAASEAGGELKLVLAYAADLFEAETIDRMLEGYRALLEGAASAPATEVSALPILGDAERRRVLVAWNETRADFPRDRGIHDLFTEQARRTPDAVALSCDGERVTYAELDRRTNQLARHLVRRGVGPESLVGILCERSIALVTAVLGVLKAGAAYVPLDPAYPRARNEAVLDAAEVALIVTQDRLAGSLPRSAEALVRLDADAAAIAAESDGAVDRRAWPDSLAYVIYTSGSTGKPKGVAIEHHSAVAMIAWAAQVYAPEELRGVLFSTSICFDLSIFEMFVPLASGGAVIIAPDALHLPRLVEAAEVTLINTVPTAIAELVRTGGVPASVRIVNLAGEPLHRSLADQIYAIPTVERLYNLYGPTEDTTYSTWTLVDRGGAEAPTIGRALANSQAYVLDAAMRPVPIGVIGELYLGGEGVARGYLRRPDLTGERFLPDCFSASETARLYRTGDRARLRADGQLKFFGRVDHQVKVRGFRVELGEIEAVLGQHPAAREVVVAAREDTPGDKRLVAYLVVHPGAGAAADLRAFLRDKLPEFMIPSAFVLLDALPRTPNGKIDRKALPAPESAPADAASAFVAPASPTEQRLAAIWAEVLGVPRVGATDDFFELGGHSLLATKILARVRDAFSIDLPLKILFETPTVRELAIAVNVTVMMRASQAPREALSAAPAPPRLPPPSAAPPPIERRAGGGQGQLSFAQQRLWLLEHLLPGSAVYNVPQSFWVDGALDVEVMTQALSAVAARHEVLRTTFATENGAPALVLHAAAAVPVRFADLRRLPEPERAAEALRLMREEARRPFDIARDLMIRATIVRVEDERFGVVFVMHHIASDGWSLSIFFRELLELYGAIAAGRPPRLPDLSIQYADFASWQRAELAGAVLDADIAYWKRQLAGAPPLLPLPTDRPRPPTMSYRGGARSTVLPRALLAALKALGQREGATLFMTLLAAFQTLLHRYSAQDDVLVGCPVAGRTRTEVEPLIGFFVNTLVLRADLSSAPSFLELLGQVRAAALDAFAHQSAPFEKLVEELRPERAQSRSPIFQVSFMLQNAPKTAPRLDESAWKPAGIGSGTTKFDLTLVASETDEGLKVLFDYAADLFDAATIERMLGHLRVLLESIVADPTTKVTVLPMLTEEERRLLLVDFNETKVDFPAHQSVHQLFRDQAARAPDSPALTFQGQTLTYRDLDRRSNQLARYLQRRGVGPETLVGISVERSIEMVVGLLGVLKAGGAYMPLDPAYPRDRLAFMIADARLSVLLTQDRLAAGLPDHEATVVRLDADAEAIAREADAELDAAVSSASLAYVIYTSGSTGKPKGVAVTHRSAVNFLHAMKDRPGLSASDRLLAVTSLSFDIAGLEIWLPLTVGAHVEVASKDEIGDGERLLARLSSARFTVMQATPSAYRLLFSVGWRGQPDLKVLIGGEAVPRDLASRLLDATASVWNMYGPTETTIWSTTARITEKDGPVLIGQPIDNTRIFLLDRDLGLVPIGVPGELYIGGDGLARGYLGRPDLTGERFIASPFDAAPGARLYRTGDLCRRRPDGSIEFLRRVDHQVKVRGYRIELGEIEAVVGAHPAAREVVAVVREDQEGDPRLVAYVALAGGAQVSAADLRAFARVKLPDHMVPSAFVILDRLPRTPSGKIDRKALPAPEHAAAPEGGFVAPRTPIEEAMAKIWADVLRLPKVGVGDSFFDLGGHSMLAVRMMAEVTKVTGRKVPLAVLFENQTIEQLSRFFSDDEPPVRRWPTLVTIQPKGTRRPLFCVSTFNVNALGYVALARNLGQDQPVYGLQSQYRDETRSPYETHEFESLAKQYIEAMKEVQPHGPYYFCGMCEGAHISFEMARLLRAAGEEVGLLGILDAWPIENTRNYLLSQLETYRVQLRKRWKGLQKLGSGDRAIALAGQAREGASHVVDRVATALGQPLRADPGVEESKAARSRALEEHFKRRYWPGPAFVPPQAPCAISLFRVLEQPYWRVSDPECGWGPRTSAGVEIYLIAGDHLSMLREPDVRVLAEKLSACLTRAGVADR